MDSYSKDMLGQPQELLYKKSVLKNFVKFKGK